MCRQVRGVPRSDIRRVTWWADSGDRVQKSHCMLLSRRLVSGMALLGVDEVLELAGVADEEDRGVVAHQVVVALLGVELDREAARVAAGVRRCPARLRRWRSVTNTGVRLPSADRKLALVHLVTSSVTSKNPCAPLPLACTTRSGTRSRLKCCIFWTT